MKNFRIFLFATVVVLVSCQQKKIDRMQSAQDSISQQIVKKDSAILDFVSTMNEIQENLDSIKQVQEIVQIDANGNNEMKPRSKDQIIADIRTLNDLLQKNKDLVARLQKKLNSSNVKIVELQKSIALLNKQIQEKDEEIASLNEQLQKLNIDVANLNTQLKTVQEDNSQKEQVIQEKTHTIDQQTTAINTAYYAFGTVKELIQNNVIEKEGGVLGMGRSLKMKEDFNKDYFTQVDIRDLKSLQLYVKKAQLITNHPAGSYHFVGEKPIESLVIDNPQEFWKTSKYLIIAIE